MSKKEKWDWELGATDVSVFPTWSKLKPYRDLLFSLVRKELTAGYQQSIMGVTWLFFQPLLTTLLYVLVFGNIVRVDTGGIPGFLFYLCGSIVWSFFSDCLLGVMYTFLYQAQIFQKVFFPRILVPMAQVITHGFRFGIQLLLFLIIWLIWSFNSGSWPATGFLLLFPLFLLQLVLLAAGLGLWLSVAVSRFRDVEPITVFLLRLAMFATPVLYPLSIVPADWLPWFQLNPLTILFEGVRKGFFGEGQFQWVYWGISWLPTLLVFYLGLRRFQQQQIQVMDTL